VKHKQYLWFLVLIVALAFSVLPTYSQQILQHYPGFQVSTIGALNAGVYEGATTIAELKQHGDFGLGTFEELDGEMVLLKGKVYQIKSDGIAYPAPDDIKTPFSAVTFFRKERSHHIPGQLTYQALQQQISDLLSTQNLPHAIRIQGFFPYLKVRSIPKQTPPYPPLSEVVGKQQRVFELRNVRGTLVGFRLPQYLKSVNAVGYHLHFISSDHKIGGHLLDGEFLNAIADVETLRDWQMTLPDNTAFAQATLD
jgi:acetolactate decarboxylase